MLCKWQIQVQRQFLPIPTDERRRLLLDSKLSLHDVRNEYLILPNPPSQSTSLLSSAEHHPLSRPIEINPKTGNRSEMKTKQKNIENRAAAVSREGEKVIEKFGNFGRMREGLKGLIEFSRSK